MRFLSPFLYAVALKR